MSTQKPVYLDEEPLHIAVMRSGGGFGLHPVMWRGIVRQLRMRRLRRVADDAPSGVESA